MDSNLFVRLFKYRPRPDRKPLEDFVTECVAYIFENDTSFLRVFLIFLLQDKLKGIHADKFNVETQVPLDCGRIDLAITWLENDIFYSLFLEHKIWSIPWESVDDIGKREDQIATYCNYQTDRTKRNGSRKNFVALISDFVVPGYSKEERPCDTYLGNYRWCDLADLLYKHIEGKNDQNSFYKIEKEFIDFMRGKTWQDLRTLPWLNCQQFPFLRATRKREIL